MTSTFNSIRPAAWRAIVSLVFTLGLGLPTLRAVADSNPPERMTYQGFLADANGNPLGNTAPKNYDVVFRIYDAQSGGTNLWAEQQTLTVDKGYFSVLLGEGSQVGSEPSSALSTLFLNTSASDRFVDITVKGIGTGGGDASILPRLRLMASPYAFLAKRAVTAVSLSNDTNRQVVSITGTNVGINQASPAATLDVNGTACVAGSLTVNVLTNNGVSSLKGDVIVQDKLTANQLFATTCNFSLDGSAYLTMKNLGGGTNPVINFDGNDWMMYKRNENSFNFMIGAAEQLRVTSSNVVVSATGGIQGRGTIPLGGIIMWSGSNVPSGWSLCDGNNNTPDLRGRFVLGKGTGSGLTPRSLGQQGGEEAHTLTTGEMPSHSHPTSVGTVGYDASWNGAAEATRAPNQSRNNGSQTQGTSSAGNDQPHNTMPPFYVLAFIMRTL